MPVRVSAPPDTPDATAIYQHFSPHRVGLPNLVEYTRQLWRRRQFAAEMSRAKLRGKNANTVFGQAWMLLSPLLQAAVYFLLIMMIRGGFDHPQQAFQRIAHLTAGLFTFQIFMVALNTGAKSVTSAGKVLLNTNFPRLLIPLSAVRSAFFRFLPTIPLYLLIHLITGQRWSPNMLLSLYFIGTMVVFAMGMAALVATLNVYFRDTANFLPFVVRLWMYMSPILWMPTDLGDLPRFAQVAVQINPTFHMLTGYTQLLQRDGFPPLYMWLASGGWAVASVIVGFLFFISRERDFAVRVL
jgi:ABC-type polysaccharide/polyol phosphate export permease